MIKLITTFAVGAFLLTTGATYVQAASINLGGVNIRVPTVQKKKSYSSRKKKRTTNTKYAHARWHTQVHDSFEYATNSQGIWISHDEQGNMIMQLEAEEPLARKTGDKVPVEVSINGRYYETVEAGVINQSLLVVQGIEVERILGKLMSGRRISVRFDQVTIETHLRGSSTAIRKIRRRAADQRRRYASGLVQRAEPEAAEPEDSIRYFLPGVTKMGTAEVRYNIVEGKGLVLYMIFDQIEGHDFPAYSLSMKSSETKRAITLIRKAEEWTKVAKENRVGLFSKRIGFVDDVNGVKEVEGDKVDSVQQEDGKEADVPEQTPVSESATIAEKSGAENLSEASEAEQKPAQPADGPDFSQKEDPLDFISINFNSYEDGSTSAQVEHSVKGYSRRFNLPLEEALELAGSLEATLEHSSSKLERRQFDKEQTDKLFQ